MLTRSPRPRGRSGGAGVPPGVGRYTFTMLHRKRAGCGARPSRLPAPRAGRLHDAAGRPCGWAVASESVGLDAMGATFAATSRRGEILPIDDEGVNSSDGGERGGE